MTFTVNLPAGVYNVSLTSGDASYAEGPEGIFIDGSQVNTISTHKDQFVTDTYQVTVTNGILNLQLVYLDGAAGTALINGLVIKSDSRAPCCFRWAQFHQQRRSARHFLGPGHRKPIL